MFANSFPAVSSNILASTILRSSSDAIEYQFYNCCAIVFSVIEVFGLSFRMSVYLSIFTLSPIPIRVSVCALIHMTASLSVNLYVGLYRFVSVCFSIFTLSPVPIRVSVCISDWNQRIRL